MHYYRLDIPYQSGLTFQLLYLHVYIVQNWVIIIHFETGIATAIPVSK